MLVKQKKQRNKKESKSIAFRVSPSLVTEFRELCKELGITQSSIIENAMKLAIEEMKRIKETHLKGADNDK
jgi:predicted DNA-binding protein